ncbi:ATPase AAA [Pseudomonas syringae pv. actinidiae ICMP 19071]|nr:ATPase AAA [Pseudomonas syringae pv. actinidiae ICMP 19073]EPM61859.1 ATPase AAA [Pseudomonas syringae pv. actinidiae ICMP 19071]EPM79501.1 ATPase AAA [Pseudomonas syringae pv. actinidiae ICMP 19072]
MQDNITGDGVGTRAQFTHQFGIMGDLMTHEVLGETSAQQDAVLERIVGLKLARIRDRFERNHQASLEFSPELIPTIAARCTEVDSGARNIDNILSGTLMPELAEHVLARMAEDKPVSSMSIGLDKSGGFSYLVT